MRLRRTLLGLAASVLLVGGASASAPQDAPPPEPAPWHDGVRPEPRALDARVGAECAPRQPTAHVEPGAAAVAAPASGAGTVAVDAMCTWQRADRTSTGGHPASLQ